MMKETWSEFKVRAFLQRLFPEEECLRDNVWLDPLLPKRIKAIRFIENLLKNGVSLEQIDINDWNCNVRPSVYVGSGRYSRLAKNDYKLALRKIKS